LPERLRFVNFGRASHRGGRTEGTGEQRAEREGWRRGEERRNERLVSSEQREKAGGEERRGGMNGW